MVIDCGMSCSGNGNFDSEDSGTTYGLFWSCTTTGGSVNRFLFLRLGREGVACQRERKRHRPADAFAGRKTDFLESGLALSSFVRALLLSTHVFLQ